VTTKLYGTTLDLNNFVPTYYAAIGMSFQRMHGIQITLTGFVTLLWHSVNEF